MDVLDVKTLLEALGASLVAWYLIGSDLRRLQT
jgi:hypothetical protein